MNLTVRLLICLGASVLLCQCSSTKKKKVNTAELPLEKRATMGVDMNKRSHFEKYMGDPKLAKGSAGSYFQKQSYHSTSLKGGKSYIGGQKEFKTSQTLFGKSKTKGLDMTYALGDKKALGIDHKFKTDASQFSNQQAREGKSVFSGADNVFKTRSALTRSKSTGKEPHIIENYNDKGNGKKSAYSEDEVRKILNRN
jgi:hypothetical protein